MAVGLLPESETGIHRESCGGDRKSAANCVPSLRVRGGRLVDGSTGADQRFWLLLPRLLQDAGLECRYPLGCLVRHGLPCQATVITNASLLMTAEKRASDVSASTFYTEIY